MSVFLVVRNKSGAILFGRPKRHRAWPEKGCVPYWRLDDLIREECWVLPASHLLMEEHPDHAARRVAKDWAGLPTARVKFLGVDSSSLPGVLWEGRGKTRRPTHHWAIGFVYGARTHAPPPQGPWWEETKFVPVKELRGLRIGRAHRDLLGYALRERLPDA